MDQSGGGLGETGQDTMAPDQPVENTSGGMPKMSDEDLDLLFGSGEENANEGTEESGGEPQDATLAALQEAISKATDPKVIADLAKMIVEYTGGGDSEGRGLTRQPGHRGAAFPGPPAVPDGSPAFFRKYLRKCELPPCNPAEICYNA